MTVDGGAGDLQADITALAPDGGRVIVQCKRYATSARRSASESSYVAFADLAAVDVAAGRTASPRPRPRRPAALGRRTPPATGGGAWTARGPGAR